MAIKHVKDISDDTIINKLEQYGISIVPHHDVDYFLLLSPSYTLDESDILEIRQFIVSETQRLFGLDKNDEKGNTNYELDRTQYDYLLIRLAFHESFGITDDDVYELIPMFKRQYLRHIHRDGIINMVIRMVYPLKRETLNYALENIRSYSREHYENLWTVFGLDGSDAFSYEEFMTLRKKYEIKPGKYDVDKNGDESDYYKEKMNELWTFLRALYNVTDGDIDYEHIQELFDFMVIFTSKNKYKKDWFEDFVHNSGFKHPQWLLEFMYNHGRTLGMLCTVNDEYDDDQRELFKDKVRIYDIPSYYHATHILKELEKFTDMSVKGYDFILDNIENMMRITKKMSDMDSIHGSMKEYVFNIISVIMDVYSNIRTDYNDGEFIKYLDILRPMIAEQDVRDNVSGIEDISITDTYIDKDNKKKFFKKITKMLKNARKIIMRLRDDNYYDNERNFGLKMMRKNLFRQYARYISDKETITNRKERYTSDIHNIVGETGVEQFYDMYNIITSYMSGIGRLYLLCDLLGQNLDERARMQIQYRSEIFRRTKMVMRFLISNIDDNTKHNIIPEILSLWDKYYRHYELSDGINDIVEIGMHILRYVPYIEYESDDYSWKRWNPSNDSDIEEISRAIIKHTPHHISEMKKILELIGFEKMKNLRI